jgi:hypothetical protein
VLLPQLSTRLRPGLVCAPLDTTHEHMSRSIYSAAQLRTIQEQHINAFMLLLEEDVPKAAVRRQRCASASIGAIIMTFTFHIVGRTEVLLRLRSDPFDVGPEPRYCPTALRSTLGVAEAALVPNNTILCASLNVAFISK